MEKVFQKAIGNEEETNKVDNVLGSLNLPNKDLMTIVLERDISGRKIERDRISV